MSRPAPSHRPVRAVLALAVAATSLVGLSQASAAPPAPVTYAVSGVSPAYVEADVDDAFGVTLSGKGFTRKTRVKFGTCPEGKAVAPSTLTATKLVVQPPTCAAGPQDITVSEAGVTPVQTATLRGRFTFLAKPVVEALAPSTTAVTPASGPWSGGTTATVTVKADVPAKAPVQVLVTTAGGTKAVPGKVATGNARTVSFTLPPGAPGAKASVAVGVFGIASDSVPDLFTYRSTIKTSPGVWVKGAVAPTVKIDGAGFAKGTPVVTICGAAAPLVAGKAPTDRTLHVTPPAWAPTGVDADEGGVCTVTVAVTGGETSTITAGSTFTYAAF